MFATCVNHGLHLPDGKALLETGLFIKGNLRTDLNNPIEVAIRKRGSFAIHLCAPNVATVENGEPIRIYPDMENTDEIIVPNNFFQPYYNCHGLVFAESRYWINPIKSGKDANGNNVVTGENISILLADEYQEVGIDENWTVAVYTTNAGWIAHSIKRDNNQILSKYDLY